MSGKHGEGLTFEEAEEIRRRYAAGGLFYRQLGDEYGVSAATICNIIKRKVYKEAEPEPGQGWPQQLDGYVYIYALLEPDGTPDDVTTVRYVGKSNAPKARFVNHCAEARYGRGRPGKRQWLDGLMRSGRQPALTILERCADEVWRERERYWITYYLTAGAPLTNSRLIGQQGSVSCS
jgi:hypothetical protein